MTQPPEPHRSDRRCSQLDALDLRTDPQGVPSVSSRSDQLALLQRVFELTDLVIGMDAELAEARYRHAQALEVEIERRAALEAQLHVANERLGEVLASRSWRLGQRLLTPVHRLRRVMGSFTK